MTTKKLTKEQKKEENRKRREAKYRGMRERLGETLTRKATMLPTAYATGVLPGAGPVRSSSVLGAVGWLGGMALPGKVGAAFEGMGDAGVSVTLNAWGRNKRAKLPADSALRNTFFDEPVDAPESSGPGTRRITNTDAVRQAELEAFRRGQEVGMRRGVQAGTRAGVAAAAQGGGNDEPIDVDGEEISGDQEQRDGL